MISRGILSVCCLLCLLNFDQRPGGTATASDDAPATASANLTGPGTASATANGASASINGPGTVSVNGTEIKNGTATAKAAATTTVNATPTPAPSPPPPANGTATPTAAPPPSPSKGKNRWLKLVIGVTAAGIFTLTCLVICYCYYKKYSNKSMLFLCMRETKEDKKLEAFIKQHGTSTPRRYSYYDIKRMTNQFKEKLGQGGYGHVYKGKLFDSRPVAVKLLNTSKGNGEEFINEVASISKTSHVNVVALLGFCLDGGKRALIYEFMSKGSLDKYIHRESETYLGFKRLYDVAIGIARGLEYLHGGCNTRILHFDIKPHNILLDEDFCPKISDFGLAKLCARKESNVSMLGARGTIGYIAPEVFSRNFGGVSYKSDVYSYGMMVLEMVGGRKNAINFQLSNSSETYFPHWVYDRIMIDEDLKLHDRVMTKEENEIARKMILVGLWCIQTHPSHRPTMSKVIDMLQSSLQSLEIPPKPFFSSPLRSEAASLEMAALQQKISPSSSSSAAGSHPTLDKLYFSEPKVDIALGVVGLLTQSALTEFVEPIC